MGSGGKLLAGSIKTFNGSPIMNPIQPAIFCPKHEVGQFGLVTNGPNGFYQLSNIDPIYNFFFFSSFINKINKSTIN